MTWSLLCLVPLCGMSAGAWAQNVPPGLRACMSETDSLRRLVCYDKEMARLTALPAATAATPPPPPASPPPPAPSPPAAAAAPPAPAPAASPPPPAPAAAVSPAPATAAAAAPAAPAHHWTSALNIFHSGSDSRLTAHVASLDRSPNSLLLRLDNGQVWQQIGRASGDLTLRAGDSVTIEKHLGSYWLSSRYVSDMKVRLAPAAN